MPAVSRRAPPGGLAKARWAIVACAAAAAVAIGIAKTNDDGTDADPARGAAPVDARRVPDIVATPVDVANELISRVEAARAPTETSGEEPRRGEPVAVASHIGPPLDPEADSARCSDDPPSHIGEYLNPDDEHASAGKGEVSRIGEYLDPLADE